MISFIQFNDSIFIINKEPLGGRHHNSVHKHRATINWTMRYLFTSKNLKEGKFPPSNLYFYQYNYLAELLEKAIADLERNPM